MSLTATLHRPARSASGLAADAGLSSRMISLFSVAAGLAVAQHLLRPATVGRDCENVRRRHRRRCADRDGSEQLGYTAGLGLLVPLGDTVNRRLLVTALLAMTTIALIVCSVAPSFRCARRRVRRARGDRGRRADPGPVRGDARGT